MSKNKNLLIFHNRILVYMSEACVIFFGGNAFSLKGKSFFEIFKTKDDDFLEKIKVNKKNELMLVTCDNAIINAKVTRTVVEDNETVCIYFKTDDAQLVYKPSYNDEGIYQQTVGENLNDILNKLKNLENTRNTAYVTDLRNKILSFSINVYDLLSMKVENKFTTFDTAYVYFDLPEFIKETINEIKKEQPDIIFAVTPPVTEFFGINSNKLFLGNFIKSAVEYILEKSHDKRIFICFVYNAEEIRVEFMGKSSYEDYLKLTSKKYTTDIKNISDILVLNDYAKKSGAEFYCGEYENDIDSFCILFKKGERKRILEDD